MNASSTLVGRRVDPSCPSAGTIPMPQSTNTIAAATNPEMKRLERANSAAAWLRATKEKVITFLFILFLHICI